MERSLITIMISSAAAMMLSASAAANDEIEPGAFVVTEDNQMLLVSHAPIPARASNMIYVDDLDSLELLRVVPSVTASDRVNDPEAFRAWMDARDEWTVAMLLEEIEPGAFVFTADHNIYAVTQTLYDENGTTLPVPPHMINVEDVEKLDVTRVIPTITEDDRIENPSAYREWMTARAAWVAVATNDS